MPRPLVPLTPAVFHVLLALSGGDRHGYAILKDILERSHGQVRMQAGTLYGTLQRLLELDWVDEVAPPSNEVDARRRYYRLTHEGTAALAAEVERMDDLVRQARAGRRVARGRS